MILDPTWTETALRLTGSFNGPGDPFAATAEAPGPDLACGVLHWSIAHGNLQPLVKAAGEDAVMAQMPAHGGELWEAANGTIPEALAILGTWRTDGKIHSDAKRELAAFLAAPEMKQRQIAASSHVAELAYREAAAWVHQAEKREPTKKEFCWFFDLVTQHGGLKGLRLADVRSLTALYGPTRVDDAICNWLKLREKHQPGYHDCQNNAEEWRDRIADSDLDLFVLSYLRALKSVFASQGKSLNRKGTLAAGRGWVNGEFMGLTQDLV